MESKVALKGIFSFYDMWYAIFSGNEINEPNVQTCFLGCSQVPRITSVRANALAKLPEGPLEKSVFSVTGKIFHATSHYNTIFLRMVSIIYSEWELVYGENEAGFRLLNFTRTGLGLSHSCQGEHECLIAVAVPAAVRRMTERMAVPLEYHLPLPAKTATILYSPPFTGW